MNKDQVKGKVKNIAGHVQEEAGKLVGNLAQEAKGIKLQVEGRAQKNLGNAKALVKDARQAVKERAKSAA
ncbi:MAG: CsbD family protein [Rhodoferax sp.]|uniref:CsbD family protein n=1 Tax=Rhodoferax sp. TaxID=50421 RepID=UPI001B78A6E7|nr:CsbD family protein [Rhodoferax sp.]MBP9905372.1 CsbD family protein [Rhodoferax sp.]